MMVITAVAIGLIDMQGRNEGFAIPHPIEPYFESSWRHMVVYFEAMPLYKKAFHGMIHLQLVKIVAGPAPVL